MLANGVSGNECWIVYVAGEEKTIPVCHLPDRNAVDHLLEDCPQLIIHLIEQAKSYVGKPIDVRVTQWERSKASLRLTYAVSDLMRQFSR